jgi:pimeloyl-ACP methyl ester carboxylesterase
MKNKMPRGAAAPIESSPGAPVTSAGPGGSAGLRARGHRGRTAVITAAAVALVGLLAFGGGSWYFANTLESDALAVVRRPPNYNLAVADVSDTTVTLTGEGEGDWRRPGTWGLEWDGGYAQVSTIRDSGEGRITRDLRVIEGSLQPGARVRIDRFAFPGDPMRAFGLAFTDITYRSGTAELPAWLVAGRPDTWAIFVHGRAATRAEALRLLPTVHELGITEMVITYRNDLGAPPSEDGYYDFGETEWRDVEAAIAHAVANGAERVVLVGYSMGGGASAAFLERSALSGKVVAAVLDAPLVDFGSTIDFKADRANVPGPLTRFAKYIGSFRFGIDWDARNYLDDADRLGIPILLFHGTADDTVPPETSDRLAALRPDLVTYLRVEDAPHVGSWNMDPRGYEAAVREFLAGIPGIAPPE